MSILSSIRNVWQSLVQRIFWKSYVVGLAVMLVLGGGYETFFAGTSTTQAATQTVPVGLRTIVTAVKASGKVTFSSEQTMKFNQKGTVAKVNVKEGDHVKQGQVLAELDKSSVLADVQSAQLAVGASALQLQQLQADKQKTIQDAQNALDDAENQYQQAQDDMTVSQQKLPADLATAQRSVTEKQTALDQAKADLEKQKTIELQNLAQTSQSTLSSSESLLDSFYDVLTNSAEARPGQNNDDIEIYNFLYNDYSLAQKTTNSYLDSVNRAQKMHDDYGSNLATETDPTVLVQALSDARDLASSVYQLGENTYTMMQGATTGTTGFTVNDLNSARATVSGNRSKASDLVNTVQTAQANLAAISSDGGIPSVTLQAKQSAVDSAQNALTEAQDNLKLLQTQNPGDLQKLADTIAQMKADLASKQAALASTTTSTDVNIKLKQNDVAQKATSAQKASKTLLDYQLTAPFDGIVTHLDYKVGDNLLDTGDTESLTLENPDFIVVTIPLDQVDIVRVKKGMSGAIIFDAVPGQTFTGTIDTIDSTPITTSGVVSYNVEIKLPTPQDLTILSGMTATVSIETTRKENVVAVPNLALKSQGTRMTVQMADGTNARVTTGVTDGQYTEILTGLKKGDSIVSVNIPRTAAAAGATNANAAQQLLRAGGGAGGFGGGGFQGGGGGARAGGARGG